MATGYYPEQMGEQKTSKYPRVGKNYRKYGEQPGWLYDYSTDTYQRDPKVAQDMGLAPKPQSVTDQLLPAAGSIAGYEIAKEAGKAAIPAISGLLGGGAATGTAAGAAGAAGAGAAGAGVAGAGAAGGAATGAAGAGAAGATGAAGGGLLTTGATYVAPAIAAGLGIRYGVRALQGKTKNWKDASLADNAGRLVTAVSTNGLSEVANYLGNRFGGDKNRWETEKKRLEKLKEQGYSGLPDYSELKGGRSKEELVQIAKDTGGNVEFAENRNEGSLTPQDIVGYASVIEKAGKDATLDQRLDLATKALAAGAVREHHGTVDVDWSKVPGAEPQTVAAQPTTEQQSIMNAPGAKKLPGTLTPEQMRGLEISKGLMGV